MQRPDRREHPRKWTSQTSRAWASNVWQSGATGLWFGQILGLFNLLKRGKVIIPVNNMTIGTAVV
jgi:hypothetical protein